MYTTKLKSVQLSVKYALIILFALCVSSCKKDKDENTTPVETPYSGLKYNDAGNLNIQLKYVYNNETFEFNKPYVTSASDTINVSMLRYYFSNVQLKNENNQWVNLGNYNLVDFEDPASATIQLNNVPKGVYSRIRFYAGVDSVANSSGTQDGALSPANNMFWSWATGYIFYKIQGLYNGNNPMTLHIGGMQNIPVVELDLLSYKKSGSAFKANMMFNVAEVFRTPHLYDLKTMSAVIHSATNAHARDISDNIENGVFSITSIE